MFFDFQDKNKPFGDQFEFWGEKKQDKKPLFGVNEETKREQKKKKIRDHVTVICDD